MSSDQRILFSGKGGPEECAEFVRSVREYAFAADKARDNAFITDFVATCFVAPAFFWYEDLDETVQLDWKLLKRALIDRYGGAASGSSLVPTPATAASAPSPAAAPPKPSRKAGANIQQSRLGFLQVSVTGTSIEGYVSGTTIDDKLSEFRGCFGVTLSLDCALRVKYRPAREPHAITLPDLVSSEDAVYLGAVWRNDHTEGKSSPHYACLSPLNGVLGSRSLRSFWDGARENAIWKISPDGWVEVVWEKDGVHVPLEIGVFNPSGNDNDIRLFLSYTIGKMPGSVFPRCNRARLIFEGI